MDGGSWIVDFGAGLIVDRGSWHGVDRGSWIVDLGAGWIVDRGSRLWVDRGSWIVALKFDGPRLDAKTPVYITQS